MDTSDVGPNEAKNRLGGKRIMALISLYCVQWIRLSMPVQADVSVSAARSLRILSGYEFDWRKNEQGVFFLKARLY